MYFMQNHARDCSDGSDEGDFCSKLNSQIDSCFLKASIQFEDYRQCDLTTEFQCDIQRCLPLSRKCDGYFNCDDRTDELNCSQFYRK